MALRVLAPSGSVRRSSCVATLALCLLAGVSSAWSTTVPQLPDVKEAERFVRLFLEDRLAGRARRYSHWLSYVDTGFRADSNWKACLDHAGTAYAECVESAAEGEASRLEVRWKEISHLYRRVIEDSNFRGTVHSLLETLRILGNRRLEEPAYVVPETYRRFEPELLDYLENGRRVDLQLLLDRRFRPEEKQSESGTSDEEPRPEPVRPDTPEALRVSGAPTLASNESRSGTTGARAGDRRLPTLVEPAPSPPERPAEGDLLMVVGVSLAVLIGVLAAVAVHRR